MNKRKVIIRILTVSIAILAMVSTMSSVKTYAMDTNVKQYKAINRSYFGDHMPFLSRGDRGKSVKLLQETLNMRYFFDSHKRIAEDGIFGAGTEKAVKEFQKSKGLNTDGMVGPRTWDKMEGLFSAAHEHTYNYNN